MIEFKRDSVIALQYLIANKSFVSRIIARYRDTGSVASRPKSGQKNKR